MKGYILVEQGVRKGLMAAFKVSYPTVRDALKNRTHSDLSRRIRRVAVKEFGGVEQDK